MKSGPCENCPARDSSGCRPPYFGDGRLDANIVFLAETPGTPRETAARSDGPCWDETAKSYTDQISKRKPMTNWLFGESDDGEFRIPQRFYYDFNGGFYDGVENGIYYTNVKK